MIRQYTVTLHRYEDLESFYEDMETPGGNLYIPDRAVDLAKRRPLSRNTVYWLAEAEAEQVRQDPRVWAVELTLEEQNIKIEPVWTQTGNFFKGSPSSNPDLVGTDKNWGLLRMLTGVDVPGHGFDDQKRHTASISTTLDGTHVDVVIVDGHVRPNHAEFAVNDDGTGGSRVNQIDWLSYASAIGKIIPTTPGVTPVPLSYDYSSYYNSSNGDHGAMVAAIAAGNTQGWARKSTIYNISPYNESGAVAAEDALDYVKYWHQTIKPVNGITGNKNPTVVNLSWGMYRYVNVLNIQSIVHRGVTYNGPWTNYGTNGKTYQELGFGYFGAQQYRRGVGDYNWYLKISYPITAWQADVEDLIAAGIHVVVAAGNDGIVQDVSGGVDYSNNITLTGGGGNYYYNQRNSAASVNSINVGAIDASSYAPGVDWYTNRGPGIDIMAPGSGIVSAVNRTTVLPNSAADFRGLNSDRISVGDGTSFAAPQITGFIALFLSDISNQLTTPSNMKLAVMDITRPNQLVDYETPFDLAGTPNRYAFYREYWITTTTSTSTTTTTVAPTTTTTSTTSTTTTTSTSTTTTLYYPPAQIVPFPFQCYPVPVAGNINVVDNVAWYSFSVSSAMTLVVDTLFSSPIYDTHIGVYDSNGDLIGENDDTGSIDLSYLEIPIVPGTYWIAVGQYETQFNQRFRARSKVPLPTANVCVSAYDKSLPFTTTTTTSTTTSTTSTTTTSTSTTSTTSTTTAAPYIPYPVYPPNSKLLKRWCDNFTEWGLFEDQFARNFSAIIMRFSANCGWPGPTTTTSTTSTTTSSLPASIWDSTVSRLSILLNRVYVKKLPIEEPNKEFLFARGQLPLGTTLSNVGIISGTPVVTDTEYKFEQPIYIYSFISIINDPITKDSIYRQYSISVVTNGAFVPETFNTPSITYYQKDYSYKIITQSQVDAATGKTWKLKWGLLPPSAELDPNGIISVTAKNVIRPFARREFLPSGFTENSTNNDTTWETWLRTFLTRAHDFDYQFVLELADSFGSVDISITVRIIHLRAPIYESWFTTNSSTLVVDPNQLYFLVLTSEADAPFWQGATTDLGYIDNGGISKKQIRVTNLSNQQLNYRITPNSNSRLPQGVILQPDGLLIGRPSFRTYNHDPVTVPVDDFYSFSVRASSPYDRTFSDRRFTLKIRPRNRGASDNLYIRAFPNMENRHRLNSIFTNQNIISTNDLFRPTDPWFGLRKDLYIEFGVGLNKTTLSQYEYVLKENHYSKEFKFGPAGSAVVLDENNQVEYEIVYLTIKDQILGRDLEHRLSEPQDNLVDLSGSRSHYYTTVNELDLWYYKNQPQVENKIISENTVYNMKYRVRDNIGYVDDYGNLIPEWANSLQIDQDSNDYLAPIGFVPIVIVAYTLPGKAKFIAQRLQEIDFDFVTYEFDRYQLENYLSQYYDTATQKFTPGNVTIFDNDTTVFDQGSTKIVDNIEQYVEQHTYDKYLKFPKNNVFK